ncbi:MAG TPA: DNA methyltransferase [Ktedonobacteraceae bacterium]|nr:DNA methyltransferase [Ktedonobacteraceae bacterium]
MAAIEQGFPSVPLSALAELESWRKEVNRPTYHMHKWWATRLGSVLRAILIGALSDDTIDIWHQFYAPVSFADKVVLDPFMGAGTTIGEALKLGCKVIGADINPVSVFQVRKALEHVDSGAFYEAYRRVESKVKLRIRSLYQSIDPDTGEAADVLYYFWVMVVTCPTCGLSVDLFDTSLFAKHAYPQKVPAAQSICFSCGEINETRYDATELLCGGCGVHYHPQDGVAHHDKATCSHCSTIFKIIDAVAQTSDIPSYRLYALLILTADGSKKYIKATKNDTATYQLARKLLLEEQASLPLPTTTIEPGHNTNQVLRYNYRAWRDLFNDRQQYCLALLLKVILEESDTSCRELLLLLFSGTLEFNNMFCSYKGEGTGAVRHMFNHHILKPERMALENSVWGTPKSSGCFSTLFESRIVAALKYRQKPFELRIVKDKQKNSGDKVHGLSLSPITSVACSFDELDKKKRAMLLCTDSSHLDLPDESIDAVITDPPYFDFVHYSELADFFYAWLRTGLGDTYMEFRRVTTRSPQDIQQRNAGQFSAALSRVLAECKRVLKPDGLLIFSFHHSRNEGWEAVGEAIFHAGLGVVAAYPVKAEMSSASPKAQTVAPINYDAILVCKRQKDPVCASLNDALRATIEKARGQVCALLQANQQTKLSRGDLFVITQAAALSVYSRHIGHLRDDSSAAMTLADFLAATSRCLAMVTENPIEQHHLLEIEPILVGTLFA